MIRSRSEQAITLIEVVLLVVTVLIVAALLLPGLGPASTAARLGPCRSSLKQIMTGMELYAYDFDGFYVPGTMCNSQYDHPYQGSGVHYKDSWPQTTCISWRGKLGSYFANDTSPFKDIADCAAVRSSTYAGGSTTFGGNVAPEATRGFAKVFTDSIPGDYEGYYFGNPHVFWRRQKEPSGDWTSWCHKDEVAQPGAFPMVGPSNRGLGARPWGWIHKNGNLVHLDFRHDDGKGNILFLDGHVTTYERGSPECAMLVKLWTTWVFTESDNGEDGSSASCFEFAEQTRASERSDSNDE